MEYNIRKGQLYNDLDCPYDEEENKIDVYTSVYWTAEDEAEYNKKEQIINSFIYEDELIKATAWTDCSGFNYWIIQQEEENYVSVDVFLKKVPEEYTQEEIKKISDLISQWNEIFKENLN